MQSQETDYQESVWHAEHQKSETTVSYLVVLIRC